jgi:hypothetical protein
VTQAAQKLPKNWVQFTWESSLHHTAALQVNADQTQHVFQPLSCFTYDKCSAKQVSVIGKDEKRAITVLVAVSASGELLPFQAIFKGWSPASLPTPSTNDLRAAFQEAIDLGFCFEFAGISDTYWSTLQTMKDWVDHTLVPYFKAKKAELSLREDHKCILQLDVWSVHSSVELHEWMWVNHREIILLYVPGGCTGLFQPCDVGIQRPLKQALISCQNTARIQEAISLLQSGNLATLSS